MKYVNNVVVLAALIIIDIACMRKGTMTSPYLATDYLSHLGGYAAGITCGSIVRWKKRQRREREETRPGSEINESNKISALR